ncbi:hypothetical protein [Neobacillus drentensis]|uniref:hypothetical protein n=1 Tax=Neobacillus drentensis TaxID=220684 RepID=UPI001596D18A
MAISLPPDFLDNLLCELGLLLVYILLTVAIIVADLLGVDSGDIRDARDDLKCVA